MISVVVPIYKVEEKNLRECIESILYQTYKNIELLLINDGSPENIIDICQEYAKQDVRVKVFKQSNQGVSVARNKGIREATGSYITFIDADDWIDLQAFQEINEVLARTKIDILLFSLMVETKDKKINNPFWGNSNVFLNKQEIEDLQIQVIHKGYSSFKPPINMIGVAVCKVYDIDFIRNNDLYYVEKVPLTEDGLYILESLQLAKKVYYLDKPYYHYRKHNQSATKQYRENATEDYMIGMKKTIEFIEKYNKRKEFNLAFNYRAILNLFSIINQQYFNYENKVNLKSKINNVKVLCQHPYFLKALKNVTVNDWITFGGKYQGLALVFLKLKMYRTLYVLSVTKSKLRD